MNLKVRERDRVMETFPQGTPDISEMRKAWISVGSDHTAVQTKNILICPAI